MLAQMLAFLAQERSEHTGGCSGKGREDNERIGASVTGGEAERAGTVQPGEEFRGISSICISSWWWW